MSEGLEALERIKSHYNDRVCIDILEDFDLIETALKRLEELEKAFDALSKEDEKAKKLLSKEIEKNRAFEIIKRKLPPLMRSALLDYCNKEEYDLLKEAGL